jgi:hypothetical protein
LREKKKKETFDKKNQNRGDDKKGVNRVAALGEEVSL